MTLTIKTRYRHTFCLQIDHYDAIMKGEVKEVVVTNEAGDRVKTKLSGERLKLAWKEAELQWKRMGGRSIPFWVAEIFPGWSKA